jgi:hypothetical protein
LLLFNFLTAAVRAVDVAFLVVSEGQDLGEELLAIVAYELVVGHRDLPEKILRLEILGLSVPGFNAAGFKRAMSARPRRRTGARVS